MEEGVLEVGTVGGEVIVNHPDLKPDENGVGHIVFSPRQARNFAHNLLKHATIAEVNGKPSPPPVNRSAKILTTGEPVPHDYSHTQIDEATGQQKGYVVLSAEERSKGFVRPVRRTYIHQKCGTPTTMSHAIAETYARDPGFYDGTFCAACMAHFPIGENGEFEWPDGTKVGT